MFGYLLRSKFAVAVVASAVTATVVGGIAWAAQSPVDAGGVIHGCYNATNGGFTLDVKGSCPTKGKTKPITWNARGIQGIPGTPGQQGPKGDAGPQGAKGDTGPPATDVYSTATMTLTSAGCPAGQYQAIITEVGAQLDWTMSPAGCHPDQVSGAPTGQILDSGALTLSQLPASASIPAFVNALPIHIVRVGNVVYNPSCSVILQGGTTTPPVDAAQGVLNFRCVRGNVALAGESDADALARWEAALAVGISGSALVISQP